MKLIENSIEVDTFGVQGTKQFGIAEENMGLVLDILRSKLYSDPIGSITREICANARDAHREVGCADKPIEITSPSILDNHWRVTDFGPGITPDRMKNVVINFGSSTKRNTFEELEEIADNYL